MEYHIVGCCRVKTLYVFCYVRPDFSNPHHASAVARHVTRLTTPMQNSLCYSQKQSDQNNLSYHMFRFVRNHHHTKYLKHISFSCFSLLFNEWRILIFFNCLMMIPYESKHVAVCSAICWIVFDWSVLLLF